ncbi:DNA polymerase III polC-type [Coriobacteriaceae bacterium EMTCatB1]|nr:DNA polymerase III polC-type [Coriobacteriaceae bacterium EMTCatB1]
MLRRQTVTDNTTAAVVLGFSHHDTAGSMLGATTLTDGDFVTVDIETTGPVPGHDSIIEIGAVRVSKGAIVGYFETLVRPSSPIPPAIVELTGITDDMVRDAPSVAEAVCAFRAFAQGAVLVAHNHRFDMGFLDYESERTGCEPIPRPVLDTLILSRRLHPTERRHNLRDVSARYGTSGAPTHRALADALATAEVFSAMLGELTSMGLTDAADVARICGLPARGDLARKLALTTDLSDGPGVFALMDERGRVLYVARARRIRSRVRSFFYRSPDDSAGSAVASTAKVRALKCSTALHAQLLESRLKARYAPPFNADCERGRRMVYIRVDTKQAYPALTVMTRRPRSGTAIGPFTNVWAVRRVVTALKEQFGLRMCGRRLNGAACLVECVHRSASSCPRPCIGAIEPDEYGARVTAALSVFDGGHARFRATLQALRERAAMDMRYEDAIVYRDTLKALDRCVSALDVVRSATSHRGSAIVERHDNEATVLLIRHGRVASVVRGRLEDDDARRFVDKLTLAARRAFSPDRMAEDPRNLTARQLRELFIVDAYRRHARPAEVWLESGPDELVQAVIALLRVDLGEAPEISRREAPSIAPHSGRPS